MHTSVKQPLLPHCAVVRLPARPVNQLVTPSTALTLELCLGKDKDKDSNRDKKKTKTKIYSLLVLSTNWSLVCWEKSRIRQPDRQTKMEMLNAQNQAEETDTYVEPWYRTEVRFFRFLIYSEFHQPTCCWE